MRIQNKYPVKSRSSSTARKSQNSAISSEKAEARPNIRPNIRKATSEDIRILEKAHEDVSKELEVNPNSPLLQAPQAPIQSENDELKSLRLNTVKKNKISKTEKIQIDTEIPSEEDNFEERNEVSSSMLSKESDEKLNALKQSLYDSEEAKKNTFVIIKDKNNKLHSPQVDEASLSREERLLRAQDKSYAHSSAWQWTFTLRPASVITGLLVLCITLGFFFTFGLIVGRGFTPTTEPVELTSIVPTEEESLLTKDVEILTAEQLEYSTALKKSDESQKPVDPNAPLVDSNNPQAASGQASQGSQGGVVPYPIGEGNQAATNVQQASGNQPAAIEIYQYVLRVASFKSEKDAKTLEARLEGSQLRADVAKSGAWYFVNVNFLGTESSFDEMRESLKKFAIRDSIVMKKDPLQLD